jgi:hypothetical protein
VNETNRTVNLHNRGLSGDEVAITANATPHATNISRYVTAIFDFEGENSSELSIQIGDLIRITKEIDIGWSEGTIENGERKGRYGMFPNNYVEKVFNE